MEDETQVLVHLFKLIEISFAGSLIRLQRCFDQSVKLTSYDGRSLISDEARRG